MNRLSIAYVVALLVAFVVALPFCQPFGYSLLQAEEAKTKITYQDHVQPIFREKCFSCHNPDKKSGGLDLTTYASVMQGGSSGEVIEPGSPDGSYLYQLVTHQSEPFMPPMSDPIPKEMQELIKAWIEGGALENSGSKPLASKKPKAPVAASGPVLQRPMVVAMPGHLELEPFAVTAVPATVKALATSPWAPLVAVSGHKQVLLYHTQSLELLGILPVPEGGPYGLRFSRSGTLLLAAAGRGGASGRVVVWDVHSGERLIEVGDELDAALAADISSDQSLIALGGPQKVVRVYATDDAQLRYELRKHTDWVLSVEFSPDGVLLASGDRAGNLFVWEAVTGRDYLTLKGHTAAITGLSWRSDSNLLASCSEDGTVRLWELENGNQVKSWNAHGGGVAAVEFTADGRLVTTGRDRVTKLWNQDGALLKSFDAFDDIGVSATYCDETHRVIAGDWRGVVRIWDANEGKLLGTLAANPPALASRLEEAQKVLAARQAELAPLKAAADEAVQAWKKATDELAAVTLAKEKAATEQNTLKKTAEEEAAKLGQQKKTYGESAAMRTSLMAVVTPLAQAQRAAAEASKAAPHDETLVKLAASVQTVLEQRQQQLAAVEKELQGLGESIAQLEKTLTQRAADIARLDEQLKNYAAMVEQLAASAKAAEEKKQAAQAAADAAQARVSEAEKNVARWKAEIEFVQRMRQLREQQAALEQQTTSQAAVVEQLTSKVTTLEKQLQESAATLANLLRQNEAAQAALKDTAAKVRTAQEKKAQLDMAVTASKQRQEQLVAAIAAISDAAEKTRVAAEKSQDNELATVAESLKKAVERKQADLNKLQQELAEAEKATAQAASELQAQLQAEQTAKKAADEAAKKTNDFQKQHEELAKHVEAARQELANAKSMHQQLIEQTAKVSAEIQAARG